MPFVFSVALNSGSQAGKLGWVVDRREGTKKIKERMSMSISIKMDDSPGDCTEKSTICSRLFCVFSLSPFFSLQEEKDR